MITEVRKLLGQDVVAVMWNEDTVTFDVPLLRVHKFYASLDSQTSRHDDFFGCS